MKKHLFSFGLFLLLIHFNLVTAQNDNTFTSPPDTTKSKQNDKKFKIHDYFSIGGFVNLQYDYENQKDNYNKIDEVNTIQVRRARLDFKGAISPRVEFRLQAEFANSVKLLDAFMKIKICQYVNIQAGQFKNSMTLENPYSPMKLESIENAQVISKLAGYKDVSGISSFSNGRDIGLALYGDLFKYKRGDNKYPLLSYQLSMYGGNGINVKDNNKEKDFSGRLDFHPFIPEFVISGTAYIGNYALSDTVNADRNRYMCGVEYQNTKWVARAEYVYGETGMFDSHSADYTINKKSHGLYAVIGYWIQFGWGKKSTAQQKLRPVLRYDFYQDQLEISNSASHYYMVGVEWWPESHIRFQINYTLRDKLKYNALGHSIAAMLSVKF